MSLDPTRSSALWADILSILPLLRTPYRQASHKRGGFFPIRWNRSNVPTDGVVETTDGDATGEYHEHGYWSDRVATGQTDPITGQPTYTARPARGVTWARARAVLDTTGQATLRRIHRRARVRLETWGPNDAQRPFDPDSAGLVLIAQQKDAGGTLYEARLGWGIASGQTTGGWVVVPQVAP